MRILSKSLLVAMLTVSCSVRVPWEDEPIGAEVNLSFTLQRNLIELNSITIDGRTGRFILGTAAPRTIVDPSFASGGSHAVQIGEKDSTRVSASPLGLGGVADAIIGADAWKQHAISIDYHSGLVTYQKEGIKPGLMTVYKYANEPMIEVHIDGQRRNAIVDTSSPDTLVLPSQQAARGTANVSIAGHHFGAVDVQYANIAHARIGNRLLSNFLITIDYGQKLVGLWRDPRNVLAAP